MSKPKPIKRSHAPKPRLSASAAAELIARNAGFKVRKYPDGSVMIIKRPDKELLISIGSDGTMTAIYDDDLVELLAEGHTEIVRASNVEPSEDGKGWVADMRPVALKFGISGEWNLKLGPFTLRNDALEAERQWIVERILT